MRFLLICFGLLLSMSFAQAEKYFYFDEGGALQTVDDLSKIPGPKKKKSRSIDSIEKTTVALTKYGTNYLVPVSFSSTVKAMMILDPEVNGITISRRLRDKLNLRTIASNSGDGTGSTSAPQVKILEIKVENFTASNLTASVEDITTKENDGILGQEFLKNFDFELDTENSVLNLKRR